MIRVSKIHTGFLTAVVAIGASLIGQGAAQAAPTTYYPSGPQANVDVSIVTNGGWTLCWSEEYAGQSNLTDIYMGSDDKSVAPCSGKYTMLTGWLNSNPSKLVVLAAAKTTDVFTETPISDDNGIAYPKLPDGWASAPDTPGNIHTNPHLANGTYWYYAPGKSIGFTPTRDLSQYPGDDVWSDGTQSLRLSWHMHHGDHPYDLQGGFSLGDNTGLNDSEDVTRAIYTMNDTKQTMTTQAPVLLPTVIAGKLATAKVVSWVDGAKIKYQWLLDGKPIKGATKGTYRPLVSQRKHKLSLRVTQDATGYETATAESNSVAIK